MANIICATRAVATLGLIVWLQPFAAAENPFSSFFGEWTLKDDQFQQVWDGETVETLSIPDHHTDCVPLNTDGSVLCTVTAGDLNGHILWSHDGDGTMVHHQSHFGSHRMGSGVGALNPQSDLKLTISFTDEPADTYRVYTYSWVSEDEYEMMSTQYRSDGEATGNWYGGTFIRLMAK